MARFPRSCTRLLGKPLSIFEPATITPLDHPNAGRCRSGRTGRSRKPLYLHGYPGFESLSARHAPVFPRQPILLTDSVACITSPPMSLENAINTFAAITTRYELWKVLVAEMNRNGVSMVAYHATGEDGRFDRLSHDGFPKDWVDRYQDEDLFKDDPFPDIASSMERPFYWHELPELLTMTPGRKKFLTAMAETEVGDGIAFYLYGPRFQNAFIGLGFGQERIMLTDARMFELQCLAQAAHLRYCVLSKKRDAKAPLTERELEVLEWIAVGKSNSVIAQIMAMSPHTVDSHVRRIFSKLDVTDRTTATLRGIGRGLIRVSDLLVT